MIHMYVGNGKGKTTASLGLLLRAAGAGKKGVFCQFLKSEETSERAALSEIPSIKLMRKSEIEGFFTSLKGEAKRNAIEGQKALIREVFEEISKGVDIAVLDEFLWLLPFGILSEAEAEELIASVPESCELVLTGGYAPGCIIDKADYITEMRKIKHPSDVGLAARKGIEY